jgi:hypothetical protein
MHACGVYLVLFGQFVLDLVGWPWLEPRLEHGQWWGVVDFDAIENIIENFDKSDNNNNTPLDDLTLRKTTMAIWACTFNSFLLSSNILAVVGLMKADRAIYLPLLGFCLLDVTEQAPQGYRVHVAILWGTYFFLMFQLIIFCGRRH